MSFEIAAAIDVSNLFLFDRAVTSRIAIIALTLRFGQRELGQRDRDPRIRTYSRFVEVRCRNRLGPSCSIQTYCFGQPVIPIAVPPTNARR